MLWVRRVVRWRVGLWVSTNISNAFSVLQLPDLQRQFEEPVLTLLLHIPKLPPHVLVIRQYN
ncbi:hypothetical protein LINPERHAP1_LOCUS31337 [Linum perenne]